MFKLFFSFLRVNKHTKSGRLPMKRDLYFKQASFGFGSSFTSSDIEVRFGVRETVLTFVIREGKRAICPLKITRDVHPVLV